MLEFVGIEAREMLHPRSGAAGITERYVGWRVEVIDADARMRLPAGDDHHAVAHDFRLAWHPDKLHDRTVQIQPVGRLHAIAARQLRIHAGHWPDLARGRVQIAVRG